MPDLCGRLHEECLTITATFGISGVHTTCIRNSIALFRGYPATIRTDQGPEFTCRALGPWGLEHGAELRLIRSGKPTPNGFIESLNGRFRDECLNEHWYSDIAYTKKTINDWRQDYNECRPHSSLDYQRCQQNLQRTGETGNMKKNQPTLLTEGCI